MSGERNERLLEIKSQSWDTSATRGARDALSPQIRHFVSTAAAQWINFAVSLDGKISSFLLARAVERKKNQRHALREERNESER